MQCITIDLSLADASLIELAAKELEVSVSEFILQSARVRARDVICDQMVFHLNDIHFEQFLAYLENPPPPNEALVALLNTPAPWESEHSK